MIKIARYGFGNNINSRFFFSYFSTLIGFFFGVDWITMSCYFLVKKNRKRMGNGNNSAVFLVIKHASVGSFSGLIEFLWGVTFVKKVVKNGVYGRVFGWKVYMT